MISFIFLIITLRKQIIISNNSKNPLQYKKYQLISDKRKRFNTKARQCRHILERGGQCKQVWKGVGVGVILETRGGLSVIL